MPDDLMSQTDGEDIVSDLDAIFSDLGGIEAVSLVAPLRAPPVPAEPPKPVVAVKPVEPPVPVEPPKPVVAVKPVEPPAPVEPPNPVVATKPVEPPAPVEPPNPVVATKPVEPPAPVEPPKPVVAVKPVEPPAPVEPPKPVEAYKPVSASKSALAVDDIPPGTSKAFIRRVAFLYTASSRAAMPAFAELLSRGALAMSKKPVYLRPVLKMELDAASDPAPIVEKARGENAVAVIVLTGGLPKESAEALRAACARGRLSFRAVSPAEAQAKATAMDIMVEMMLLPGEA